jgi:alpha-galactosidase
MKRILGIVLTIIILTLNGCKTPNDKVYDARIQENEILRPKAEKLPRINGPKVAGARPGKKFIYRIPCQGQRPIKFNVEGLTDGLNFDSNKGIITGTVPTEKGEYDMVFSSTNAYGKATRSFKLVVGDKISLTPPTGWNSWGGQMIFISDEIVRKTADFFVEQGLADVGFQYIGIDDCWMKLSPELYANRREKVVKMFEGFSYEGVVGEIRDSAGNIIPNESFPDMKAMTDYVHSYGLKAGIYSSPGITTCQDYAGSFGYQEQDARQYAQWGFDLLKYDLCGGREDLKVLREEDPEYSQSEYWKPMTEYLKQQERDILFNLCQYGREKPWTWAPELGIQSWRIGGDLNHNVNNYFNEAMRIAKDLRQYSGPGHWNDPDFMYIHKLRDVLKKVNPSKEITLNTNQRYQYVSLWSIICAPFFFSSDILEMDDFTIGLLTNADILNINQDELTHVAEVVRENENETVMIKKMADGSKVLALFNRNAQKESVIRVPWSEVSEKGNLKVYDVWRQKELGAFEDELLVKLSPDGVGLFIIRKKPN